MALTIIQIFLALIFVFSGLFIGLILALSAKEELKQGKKYLLLIQWIIPFLTLVLLVIYFNNIYVWLLILVFVLLYLFVFKYCKYFLYWALAVLFFLSTINNKLFIFASLLIFIYGLSEGSLYYYETCRQYKNSKKKGLKKLDKKSTLSVFLGLLKKNYVFLIIVVVLFFINIFI